MGLFVDIDHIELVVSDYERSVEFYKKLGTLVRETTHHGKSAEILIGKTMWEIHAVTLENSDEVPGVQHISFRVDGGREDLLETIEELRGKGIKIRYSDRYHPQSGRLHFNFRDPDGHRLQASLEEREIPSEG
jgi:catechol 2,3-dioxygenase-like lactoylglutathione lyase family enzyme